MHYLEGTTMLHPRIYRSLLTILARVAVSVFLGAQFAVPIASAQVLVGNPYVTGFEGWTSTYVTAPTQVGPPPSWGVLLTPDPTLGERFLFEASDGREADAVTTAGMGDGKYKPYLMINTADTTPASYTINYQLASMDNDGFGVVFGYQDNDNYFRVGFREQADGNLGFEEGTSVQKVVNGVITNLANSQAGFLPPSTGATFNAKVVVNGTNWDIQVDNTSILSGTDPDLKPGKYGVHSWAQREVGTTLATPTYGTMVGPISVTSATLNKTHNFVNALSSVPWRRIGMMNSVGETGIAQGEDYGNFAQDFTNGTIRDDSNGFADATAGAPNTDFIGPAIVVNSPNAATMTNYRYTTRVENRDNDGIGLLVRVEDDDSFYRINWATEGPGTGTTRPPLGMSVQKYHNGTWTQVFTETTPKFLPADSVPFDVSVQVVGNSIAIDVLDNPDSAPRSVSYDTIVDSSGPILMGSVGFTNWGNGDGGNGAVYSAFGGDGTALVSAITTITDFGLTVDRSTNNVTLTNTGSASVDIREVSILSPNGALNPATWTSISDAYDEPPGSGSVDADDPWTEITSTAFELTEREQSAGGNGGTLSAGEMVNLGNIWQKSQLQDLALVVELADGSTHFGGVTYTAGPGGMAYARSDLNVDGLVNASDWSSFYPNMLSDLSAMSGIQRALAGDLDRDGDVDVTDFVSFKTDYDAANGAGAFNAMVARVPEPSTIAILLATGIAAAFARQRRKYHLLSVIALCVLASSGLGDRLSASPVDLTTYDFEAFPPAATFPAPVWDVTPTMASLGNNSDATVLYSPANVINKKITGTLTPGSDDDVVGFVLGFEPGDSAIGSSADYILIDWKGANQNFNFGDPAGTMPEFHNLTGAGDMPAGLAISRVTGSANADELWTHTDNPASPTGGVRQLARGSTLGTTPYNRQSGPHQFEIVYTDTLINVKVDGVEQFNVVGSFPAGRFGLYSAWQGPTATFTDFDISDEFTISALTATVDRSTGSITINNPFSTPVNFDFYQFTSASNSLNDETWLSLSDQNFQPAGGGEHQKWQEAGGSSPSAIAEVFLDGNSTLDTTTSTKSIGAAYNNLINGEDLVFQYRLATGSLRTGFVQYVGMPPASLQGDYNMNGVVDAADYVVWRKTDGTPAGYNLWRTNFGRTAAGGAASLGGAASVPEPATVGLVLAIIALAVLRQRSVPLLAAHR
jgi:hypothetical protein